MQPFPQASPYRASGGGSAGGQRRGVPRPNGRTTRDDTGRFHPFGMTFFWAMQGAKYEPEHYAANAQWLADEKVDAARILTEVDWAGNRKIDPTSAEWGDWAKWLMFVIDDLYERGVRVIITIRGKGTATQSDWLARVVGKIVADGRAHKVLYIETENEYLVGGDPIEELVGMAVILKSMVPNIVALSTPGDVATAAAIKSESRRIGIEGYTYHSDRGGGDHKWRQVRQGYDMKEFAPLWASSGEPPGPGSSVDTNTSPLQLAMMRAVSVMCGGSAYVLHTGTGVYGDGKAHPSAGPRPANFWEIPGIVAIMDAVRGIDALLPEGVENWRVANTGWTPPNPVAPFQPHHHWEGNPGDGVNKAYSALAPDGRFVQMPCGVRGHVSLTASYSMRDVTVYNPLTRQALPGFENRSFAPGESMDLPGGGQDAMVAYIIHGRRA